MSKSPPIREQLNAILDEFETSCRANEVLDTEPVEREKILDAIIALFEPEPPAYAEMTVEEFQNALDQLAITPDDGCADAIAGVRVLEENINILAPLPAGTTHIRWYNK